MSDTSARFQHENSAASLREAANDSGHRCSHERAEFRTRANEESHLAATSPEPTPAERAAEQAASEYARDVDTAMEQKYIGH